jgi:hypothetical protein
LAVYDALDRRQDLGRTLELVDRDERTGREHRVRPRSYLTKCGLVIEVDDGPAATPGDRPQDRGLAGSTWSLDHHRRLFAHELVDEALGRPGHEAREVDHEERLAVRPGNLDI